MSPNANERTHGKPIEKEDIARTENICQSKEETIQNF